MMIIVIISMMYLFGDICRMIALKKTNRHVEMATFNNFIDTVLFASAATYVYFYYEYIHFAEIDETNRILKFVGSSSLITNTLGKFDFLYLFAIILGCMTLKIIYIFGFNKYLGALQEIVIKMMKDFLNFLIIFMIICIMFTLMGHFWFCIHVKA